METREVTKTTEVPAHSGVDGFLHALREIIGQPRVQRIVIEASGKITYTRQQGGAEESNQGIDYGPLEPYNVMRNHDMHELSYPRSLGASDVLTAMFDLVTNNGFTPICFAVGQDTELWNWFHFTSGVELQSREMLYGYPVYPDQQLPRTALVLMSGVGRTRALIDTRLSVKVEMQQNRALNDELEIL